MSPIRLATTASPTTAPLSLTVTGAKLLLKSYFVARQAGLSVSGEIALYAYLVTRALKRETDWVQISTEAIASELDVNERTLTRWLAALADRGWIERRAGLRSDGTREVARTRLPMLSRVRRTCDAQTRDVTRLEPEGQGTITAAEARPVLESLRHAPELTAIADRATRERIRAEITYSILRCALSRLPDLPLRLNVARKKLRERAWRTPRSMPPNFHATFARLVRELEPPEPISGAKVAQRQPAAESHQRGLTPGQYLEAIAHTLNHPTRMSEKETLLDNYPRASSSPPGMSVGVR